MSDESAELLVEVAHVEDRSDRLALFYGDEISEISSIRESEDSYTLEIQVTEEAAVRPPQSLKDLNIENDSQNYEILFYTSDRGITIDLTKELVGSILSEDWDGAMEYEFSEKRNVEAIRDEIQEIMNRKNN